MHSTADARSPDWDHVLREHGLRVTRASVAVLGVLSATASALSHDEVLQVCMQDAEQPFDRVTVYRVLDRLTQAGLADRLMGSDGVARFMLHDAHSSQLFECQACHRLVSLPQDAQLQAVLERLNRSLKRRGMQPSESALRIRGTCADCR
ncbi:Fur family transcriptional regulator [Pseudacidovorax intermedius]|uniref:Fur family ferric uptake transcriptional regulator n=1 Tax=Pseudacidovorax intermedius TaxID=433924 RepID=A0A370FRZ1_9BURK|nr:transcriptional repressor [Pseudacidovorax intermedius]RDI28528.1 Fur family ferric uptake transcriptional regulator [Pseudacidovorax intermedius]